MDLDAANEIKDRAHRQCGAAVWLSQKHTERVWVKCVALPPLMFFGGSPIYTSLMATVSHRTPGSLFPPEN